jgi:hypothetical protein
MIPPDTESSGGEIVALRSEIDSLKVALSEALEQQTATGEILQVISRSPTEIQPVFEMVVRNAVRLCDGFFGIVFQYDGHKLSIVAHHNFSARAIDTIARSYPSDPGPEAMDGRAVFGCRPNPSSSVRGSSFNFGSSAMRLSVLPFDSSR